MNMYFAFASALTVLIGLVHSILGEKFIINPLQRLGNLPKIFGSDQLTKHTLRFAWHLTTVAWFGLASLMFLLSLRHELTICSTVIVLSVTFAASFLVSLIGSRAKHFSWLFFLAITVLLLLGL